MLGVSGPTGSDSAAARRMSEGRRGDCAGVKQISVIIPAYNAATTIGVQLDALSRQTYAGDWEVIVADNGSTDDTRAMAESYSDRLPDLKVVDASDRRGAGPARNRGARAASAPYLAFCDADDRVEPEWLAALASALEHHDFVTGSVDHDSLNSGESSSHWRSHVDSLPLALRFLPYALSGNMGVKSSAFHEVGGFPEDMDSVGEDVALSWALQLAGYDLYFEPKAVVAYRHKEELGSLWRQHSNFGLADVVLYKRFRSYGVPPRRLRSVAASYWRLLTKLPWLFLPAKRSSVVRTLAKHWGRLRGSCRERVLYL